jgi:hypothetical protein
MKNSSIRDHLMLTFTGAISIQNAGAEAPLASLKGLHSLYERG